MYQFLSSSEVNIFKLILFLGYRNSLSRYQEESASFYRNHAVHTWHPRLKLDVIEFFSYLQLNIMLYDRRELSGQRNCHPAQVFDVEREISSSFILMDRYTFFPSHFWQFCLLSAFLSMFIGLIHTFKSNNQGLETCLFIYFSLSSVKDLVALYGRVAVHFQSLF